MGSAVRIADGSADWSLGVDSSRVTTVQSAANPNGLSRQNLAWLMNGTVRDNGINQRFGWTRQGTIALPNAKAPPLFQGKMLFTPTDGSQPFYLVAISGQILAVTVDGVAITNLSLQFGIQHPASQPYFYFEQANQFVVIQAGDGVTLPLLLYFNGPTCVSMVRSRGIIGPNNTPAGGVTPYNQIPATTAMKFYQGRIFYALGDVASGGDIEGGAAGTALYDQDDSVLYVTENPLATGGDGFKLPGQAGNIRAMAYASQLDASLGQGILYIFTRQQVFMLQVPISRANWIAATNNNQPLLAPVQLTQGAVNDRTVVAVNSDLFYQTLLPSIASLSLSTRYFQQWGNVPISANEDRILAFVNRGLMRFDSGCQFDNRLLQATLPQQTPSGVVCTAIIPLDFNLISSFNRQLSPAWEGHLEGLQIFQLSSGDFGGLERCFATVLEEDGTIALWELTSDQRFDMNKTGQARVTWYFETPAFTWGKELDLKKLDGLELFIDKVFGTVELTVEWRPDSDVCYKLWGTTSFCVAKDCAESVNTPASECYPTQPNFREGFKMPVTLGPPPQRCNSMGDRPADVGFQHQIRVTVTGWCRIRQIVLWALPLERPPFPNINCGVVSAGGGFAPPPQPAVINAGMSTITPPTATVVGNGTNEVIITVTAKDQFGNNYPAGGANVFLTLSGPGTLTQPIDQQNGTYVAIYKVGLGSGIATITGTLNGVPIGGISGFSQSVITATSTPSNAGHSLLLPGTIGGIEADGLATATVTVTARDVNGVNVGHGGDAVVFAITGLGTVSAAMDNGDGTYTGTVTSPYVNTGTGTVTATLDGAAVGSISGSSQCVVTFTTILPSPVNSTVVATSPVVANGVASSAITITIRDSRGVVMSGQSTAVTYNTPGGAGNFNLSISGGNPVNSNGSGQVTGTLTSTVSSNKSPGGIGRFLSAVSNTVAINQTAAPVFNEQNPSSGASLLAFSGGSVTPTAHGTPCQFTCTLRDPNNNPVQGATVTGAYGGAGVTIAYPNGQVSDTNGNVVFTVNSPTLQGPFNVSATWAGSPWTGGSGVSGTVTQTQALTFN